MGTSRKAFVVPFVVDSSTGAFGFEAAFFEVLAGRTCCGASDRVALEKLSPKFASAVSSPIGSASNEFANVVWTCSERVAGGSSIEWPLPTFAESIDPLWNRAVSWLTVLTSLWVAVEDDSNSSGSAKSTRFVRWELTS